MEKLIFKKYCREIKGRTTMPVRLRMSTMEFIEEIEEETKLSKQEIIDRMVKFAYEHIEWEE